MTSVLTNDQLYSPDDQDDLGKRSWSRIYCIFIYMYIGCLIDIYTVAVSLKLQYLNTEIVRIRILGNSQRRNLVFFFLLPFK